MTQLMNLKFPKYICDSESLFLRNRDMSNSLRDFISKRNFRAQKVMRASAWWTWSYSKN